MTPGAGLLNPNHFLSAAIAYLFGGARDWAPSVAVGKTLVSSAMIDRVTADLGRRLLEVPVGFKWFVDGLVDGSVGFGGEESAGASFLRRDGTVWTTDKDGIIACLLAAELTARSGHDPGVAYGQLTERFGAPAYRRIDAPATKAEKAVLGRLSADQVTATSLAGDEISSVLTTAPGNGAAIGGLKVATANGWFAARPSGTEDVYKIYAESFRGEEHLGRLIEEAQALVSTVLAAVSRAGDRADPDQTPPEPRAAGAPAAARALDDVDPGGRRAGRWTADPVRAVRLRRAVDAARGLPAGGAHGRPRGAQRRPGDAHADDDPCRLGARVLALRDGRPPGAAGMGAPDSRTERGRGLADRVGRAGCARRSRTGRGR